MEENNVQKKANRRWLLIAAGVFGASLISAGVFASTQISVNSGTSHIVNLGAGAASVTVCGSNATISAQQTYLSSSASYNTTTFSITGLGAGNCGGKVLSLSFSPSSGTINTATWTIPSSPTGAESYVYGYGSNGGSCSAGGTCQAASGFTAFDTYSSTLSTVAIAVQ